MRKPIIALFILVLLFQLFVMSKDLEFEKDHPNGKKLATVYCGACHKVPLPNELDKVTWKEYILPRMKKIMGIESIQTGDDFFEYQHLEEIKARGVFMDFSTLPKETWNAIEHYYISKAPESLHLKEDKKEPAQTTLFTTAYPPLYTSPPSTSLIRIEGNQIWWGDIHTNMLYILNQNYDLVKTIQSAAQGLVDMDDFEGGKLLTYMGSFSPTDDPLGVIYSVDTKDNYHSSELITGLRRPVHTQVSDINGDGKEDVVVSEFGKWLGQLSVFINKGDRRFEKTILSPKSGSISSAVVDLNQDGLMDILGLFAQGDEHISVFYQQKDGRFLEKRLLDFPPSFGSTGFHVADFNKDKKPDILYFNGDLADFPMKAKPYQGLRIYLNNGRNQFTLQSFLPASGVYQAHLFDYDMDNDLDIFCNSFFPNQNTPKVSGLSFFENSKGKYYKKTFEAEKKGRWIVSGIGDFDQDKDTDIIVGNLIMELPNHEKQVEEWVRDGLPFILLKNQTFNPDSSSILKSE